MSFPILRAKMSSGVSWDDPSEDLLFDLLTDMESGREQFMVVERLGIPETYAQAVMLEDGSFLMEYRAGSADQHFAATSNDKRVIHSALTGWAFELDGWSESLDWQPAGL